MEDKFIFRYYSTVKRSTWYHEPRPVVTVVGIHEVGILKLAAARCSEKDQFEKKVGRELAEKRLSEGKHVAHVFIDECRVKDFIKYAEAVTKIVNQDPRSIKK